jgi:N-acetylmuramoyl-L-alanine amidase
MQGFLAFIAAIVMATGLKAQTITIMIDPGHGGSDPGHLSANEKHLQEKDLNLIIAQKFGGYLSSRLSNVKVIYTRTTDVYPSLDERVQLANNSNVDYFISIHCNGADNTKIAGTESHVHSMSSLKSVKLAKEFEKEFSTKAGRKSRGVKDTDDREHTLQVLKFTQMTSVLVECGFLTNPKEAAYLNTAEGQDIIASALFRGMRAYLKSAHPKIDFTGGESTASGEKTGNSKAASYTVQIMSSKEELSTGDPRFKKLSKEVVREKVASTGYRYRYVSGRFPSKSDAQKYCNDVKKNGFPDAIVIKKG